MQLVIEKKKIFVSLFIFAIIFLVFNTRAFIPVDGINAVEKLFFLFAGVAFFFRPFNKDVALLLFLSVLIILVCALFTKNPNFSWATCVKSMTQVIIVYLLCAGKISAQEKELLLKFFAWLPAFILTLGVVYHLTNIRPMFTVEFLSGLPRLGLTMKPAFLGGFSVACIYAAFKCANYYGYKYFWLVVLNVLILLASTARIPLVMSFVLCAYVFFANFKGQKNLKMFAVLFGVFFGVVIVVVAGDLILGRLTQTHMSGREIIWEHLRTVSAEYPNFGVGFGHQVEFMTRDVTILTGGTIGAHSELLRIKVELGVIPSILFFVLFALMLILVAFNKSCTDKNEILIAGGLFFVFSYFDNALATPSLFLYLILVVLVNSNRNLHERDAHRNLGDGFYLHRNKNVGMS
ncbi:O-antigen ligase family protein [Agaribacter flavus]|uniref:O-antigen ligase family protein n=1 Tax=Agaribacter flavus TaxID=1902781 RepID=A0ABV7FPA8_9ALTE